METKSIQKKINIQSQNEKKTYKYVQLPTYEKVKKVKGIFRNLEYPGTGISFPFRMGWRGPVQQFTLFDGTEYEIPETLAEHLNNNCTYKEMTWIASDGKEVVNAKPISNPSMPNFIQQTGKIVHRFLFQIIESEYKKDVSLNVANN